MSKNPSGSWLARHIDHDDVECRIAAATQGGAWAKLQHFIEDVSQSSPSVRDWTITKIEQEKS